MHAAALPPLAVRPRRAGLAALLPLLVRGVAVSPAPVGEGVGGGGRGARADGGELGRVEIVVALVGGGVHDDVGVVGGGARVVGARRVEVRRHVQVRVRAPRGRGRRLPDEVRCVGVNILKSCRQTIYPICGRTVVLHRVAVTWIPKLERTFDEIPKMSPGGDGTHDPVATLSKL